MTTRGITVLAGDLKETQEITRLAEAAGFDAAWSGEFLHRSGIVSAAAMAAVTSRTASEVRDMLPALERRYDHAALYSPSFTLTPERVAENTRAIIETFAVRR